MTTSISTIGSCANGWVDYRFYGPLAATDPFTISSFGVSGNVYYYQVRIIYGLITIDGWNGNTKITTTFDTDPASTPNTV